MGPARGAGSRLAAGGGAHTTGIGAEVRFGQAEAADRLAGRETRDPAVLLLLRAEGMDRVHDQAALHRREAAQPRVTALELLRDQAVGDAAQAGQAIVGDAGAEQVEGAHLGHQLERGASLTVALLDDRLDLVVDESADGVAHHPLFGREEGIHLEKIDAWETAHGDSSFDRARRDWGVKARLSIGEEPLGAPLPPPLPAASGA